MNITQMGAGGADYFIKDDVARQKVDAVEFTGEYVPGLAYTAGYVAASDGAIVSGGAYRYSQLIEVYEGLVIEVKGYASPSVLLLAMYADASSAAIVNYSVFGTNVIGQTETVTIPYGVKYVRISTESSYLTNSYVKMTHPSMSELSGEVQSLQSEIDGDMFPVAVYWIPGCIMKSSGEIEPSQQYVCTSPIRVTPGQRFEYVGQGSSAMYAVGMYATAGATQVNTTYSVSGKNGAMQTSGVIPQGINFIRICTNVGYKDTSGVSLGAARSIPFEVKDAKSAAKRIPLGGYIHPRRPTVAFMQDGEYDLNRQCMEAYKNHGVVCTFAIQWDTAFTNNSKQDYLDWQADGFEITAHSSQSIGSGSATDEQVAEIIEDAYETMTGYGFDVRSLVSLAGNTRASAYPIIKRYFECGFTTRNHYGSEQALINLSEDPYELWRYSLESSTDAEAKAAVDSCITNTGLLIFYWHARSENEDYSVARLNSLLDYIATKKEIQVIPAYMAVADYYAIRRSDLE